MPSEHQPEHARRHPSAPPAEPTRTRPTGDEQLSLIQAAGILGVHYMTVYRYVRQGKLAASRDGLEWRVRRVDVEAYGSGAEGRTGRGALRTSADRRGLERRMLAGDGSGAWWLVESHLGGGLDPSGILTRLVVPALRSIGERWASGDLSVADEHRATAVAQRLIGRLGLQFGRRGKSRGTVALAAPAGDLHALPVAIVADLFRWRGFDVVELGGNTPAEAMADAADRASRLVAVGVGASTQGLDAEVAALVAAVRRAVPEVPIVVGGGAVRSAPHAHALGGDIWPGTRPDGAVVAVERLVGPAPAATRSRVA